MKNKNIIRLLVACFSIILLTGCLYKIKEQGKLILIFEFSDGEYADLSNFVAVISSNGSGSVAEPLVVQDSIATVTFFNIPIGTYYITINNGGSFYQSVGELKITGKIKNTVTKRYNISLKKAYGGQILHLGYAIMNKEFTITSSNSSQNLGSWYIIDPENNRVTPTYFNDDICTFSPTIPGIYEVKRGAGQLNVGYIVAVENIKRLKNGVVDAQGIDGTPFLAYLSIEKERPLLVLETKDSIVSEVELDNYPFKISVTNNMIAVITMDKIEIYEIDGLRKKGEIPVFATDVLALANDKVLVKKTNNTVSLMGLDIDEIPICGDVTSWIISPGYDFVLLINYQNQENSLLSVLDNKVTSTSYYFYTSTKWFDNNTLNIGSEFYDIVNLEGQFELANSTYALKIDGNNFARNLKGKSYLGVQTSWELNIVSYEIGSPLEVIGTIPKMRVSTHYLSTLTPTLRSVWYDKSNKEFYGVLGNPLSLNEMYLFWQVLN